MNESNIRRASLKELREKKNRGETRTNPHAPIGESLGREFWAEATLTPPRTIPPRSVHLKLDPEVFAFFQALGKGHLTKMQEVLRAYANAHRQP